MKKIEYKEQRKRRKTTEKEKRKKNTEKNHLMQMRQNLIFYTGEPSKKSPLYTTSQSFLEINLAICQKMSE
uniref:Uncharacterized protein n=1 Tax=Romanomermis culicivorax TaxID=13658 RepID=A0A915IA34_ROMCU